MIRTISLFFLAFCLGAALHAQGVFRVGISQPPLLTAFAGNDTIVCPNHPVSLGGFPSASGGTPSYLYLWSPAEGLNDPTSSNPVALLDQSTTYTLTVTDMQGCQAVHIVDIKVDPCLGIDNRALAGQVSIYPNPSDGTIRLTGQFAPDNTSIYIEMINRMGQVVFHHLFENASLSSGLNVNTGVTRPGLYFLKIRMHDKVLTDRLIIR